MKKTFIIIVAMFCAYNISIAQTTAPKAITTAFQKKFPTAISVKWDKENSNEYEASFTIDGKKSSANFDINGNWLETEETIDISTLPQAVTDALKKQFSEWKVEGASKISTSKNIVKIEIDLVKGKKKKEVLFNEQGVFIK